MISAGGLAPFTTVDYPGQHAAVVFCQGCPWRCHYCHNPHLQGGGPGMDWEGILGFLRGRVGLLDAVVFSGGEPLLQGGLPEAIRQVRALGFRIGLHTGGCDPARLGTVLPLVDWVGLDVKAPWGAYGAITQVPGSGEPARASLGILLESGKPFQIRTTVHPELLGPADLQAIGRELAGLGVDPGAWVLQPFRAQGCAQAPGGPPRPPSLPIPRAPSPA